MKKILFGLFLAATAAGTFLRAETNAYQFETLTITSDTVKGFTASKLLAREAFGIAGGGTRDVFCTVETNSIRFRVDGSSPTASVGHLQPASSAFSITGYSNVRAARFIGITGTATMQCSFEQ